MGTARNSLQTRVRRWLSPLTPSQRRTAICSSKIQTSIHASNLASSSVTMESLPRISPMNASLDDYQDSICFSYCFSVSQYNVHRTSAEISCSRMCKNRILGIIAREALADIWDRDRRIHRSRNGHFLDEKGEKGYSPC